MSLNKQSIIANVGNKKIGITALIVLILALCIAQFTSTNKSKEVNVSLKTNLKSIVVVEKALNQSEAQLLNLFLEKNFESNIKFETWLKELSDLKKKDFVSSSDLFLQHKENVVFTNNNTENSMGEISDNDIALEKWLLDVNSFIIR